MGELVRQASARSLLQDWRWRLNNLYWITNKQGHAVPFRLNWAQERLYDEMHHLNVILKARQLGFSTFITLFILDQCLFQSHTRAGIVDVTLDDAESKLAKMWFAYQRLPAEFQASVPLLKQNSKELEWKNGSACSVGTSHRGGTLQYLHISEFGKICAKFPERAREIVTGALNTIQAGQVAFIESTAEGQQGRFYEICQEAQTHQRLKAKLTELDFRFHFYGWHEEPDYRIDADGVTIPEPLQRYFEKLETRDAIRLEPAQKAWYVKKRATQLEDMKREYPATPEEAFEASVEGSILGAYLAAAEEDGRIGNYAALPGVPVHTFWDIGRRDYNTLWFVQILVGMARVVGFYLNNFTGMPHYAEYCLGTEHAMKVFPDFTPKAPLPEPGKPPRAWKPTPGIFAKRGWIRGEDVFPHDGRVIEWGSDKARLEQLVKAGFNARIGTELSLHDGINACRASIGVCQFDEEGCSEGLRYLRQFKWSWNEKLGCWNTTEPAKDVAEHVASGFRTFATSWRDIVPTLPAQKKPDRLEFEVVDGNLVRNLDVRSTIDMLKKRREERAGLR